jgi:hypothetical protein
VCKDAFSNARLQVVNAYMKCRGHSINNFRQCEEGGIEKSNRNRHRQRHRQDKDDDKVVVNHTYGVDGHIRLAKRMVSM